MGIKYKCIKSYTNNEIGIVYDENDKPNWFKNFNSIKEYKEKGFRFNNYFEEVKSEPKSLVGRYLKALIDNPNSGLKVNKGDYGVIIDSTFVDFPNFKGYAASVAIQYFTKNPSKQFYENKYELMPEGFKPDQKQNSYIPTTSQSESSSVITNVRGGEYEKLSDLYYQQEEEKPHIVNVQTTCINLRTKTKKRYLTL